jgi:hypothetical protein
VNQEVTESSEVQQLRVQLYQVNGSDSSRRCNCDTAACSNSGTVNCVCKSECGINLLDPIQREVICRVIQPTCDNINLLRRLVEVEQCHQL